MLTFCDINFSTVHYHHSFAMLSEDVFLNKHLLAIFLPNFWQPVKCCLLLKVYPSLILHSHGVYNVCIGSFFLEIYFQDLYMLQLILHHFYGWRIAFVWVYLIEHMHSSASDSLGCFQVWLIKSCYETLGSIVKVFPFTVPTCDWKKLSKYNVNKNALWMLQKCKRYSHSSLKDQWNL